MVILLGPGKIYIDLTVFIHKPTHIHCAIPDVLTNPPSLLPCHLADEVAGDVLEGVPTLPHLLPPGEEDHHVGGAGDEELSPHSTLLLHRRVMFKHQTRTSWIACVFTTLHESQQMERETSRRNFWPTRQVDWTAQRSTYWQCSPSSPRLQMARRSRRKAGIMAFRRKSEEGSMAWRSRS